jgi:peroxiredoxin (alkyl hydroperoxide reductase subunit C)
MDGAGKAGSRPLRLGDVAPEFAARSTKGDVRLSAYRGRWVILFSHPADFTPVCSTEFVELARRQAAFEARDCRLLALSVDSLYAHLAWVRALKRRFGVEVGFPILEDPSMAIARAFGMVDEFSQDSRALRSSYFIDPEGVIRAITCYPHDVGRSVEEMLRLLAALQAVSGRGRYAPEGWREGQPLLLPPIEQADEDVDEDWFCRFEPAR